MVLDVSKNTALTTLYCNNNKLTALNVKNANNNNFGVFRATNNPDLICIQVDGVAYSTTNWTRIDTTASFSEDCSTTPIPDANFEQALIDLGIDTNGKNGNILNSDAMDVTSLDVLSKRIDSLDGIKAFTNLIYLRCASNQLTSLDVPTNTALTYLYCGSNQLTSLDVSANTTLSTLWCSSNQLTNLDVSKNTVLTSLSFFSNKLTNLDISANTTLTDLSCSANKLTSLNVSTNTVLTALSCFNNPLTSIDISTNTALISLSCSSNQLTNLDVSPNTALISLFCSSNLLTSIDISANTFLKRLYCSSNQLTNLDVSTNTDLTSLSCDYNQLTNIDISVNTALTFLYCHSNLLTRLNVKNGNNNNFSTFRTVNNTSLICIQVDDANYSTTVWTDIDTTASFSENCDSTTQSSSTTPTTMAKSKQNTIISDFNQNKENELSGIYISPNPTKDIIYINNVVENTNYILLNIRGQALKKGILTTVNNSINLSSLARGIYFLNLKTNKGSFIKKVVKN